LLKDIDEYLIIAGVFSNNTDSILIDASDILKFASVLSFNLLIHSAEARMNKIKGS
jgi:hypothetical protein